MADNFTFEEQRLNTTSSSYKRPSGMVGFLMSKFHIQEEATANLILVIFSLLVFALAGYIMFSALK